MRRLRGKNALVTGGAFLCAREAIRRHHPGKSGVVGDAAYVNGQTLNVDGGLALYADLREPWSSE